MKNNENKISAIIVDDEPSAIKKLENVIKADGSFDIVTTCTRSFEALEAINNYHPDVAFLDIKMPGITGIELTKLFNKNHMPRLIFVTAYDEYSTQAFELGAIDYILKPFDEKKINVILSRLKVDCTPYNKDVIEKIADRISFVDAYHAGKAVHIRLNDIVYATTKNTAGIDLILHNEEIKYHYKGALFKLSEYKIMRQCHGQYIVNEDRIKKFERTAGNKGNIYTDNGHEIPIGARFMKNFF